MHELLSILWALGMTVLFLISCIPIFFALLWIFDHWVPA